MSAQVQTYQRPSVAPSRWIVETACRAPSVHNTQPWTWHISEPAGRSGGHGSIDLYADRSRQLPVADPRGRNLMLSCGAALHHAQVAAAAAGYPATVTRMPDPDDPEHLATLHLEAGQRTPTSEERLQALLRRCTDRRRFTSWPVPDDRLARLAQSSSTEEVLVVALTDAAVRFRAEVLMEEAMRRQQAEPRFAEEQKLWVEHSSFDGVPLHSVPPPERAPRRLRSRFAPPTVAGVPPQRIVESSDGLLALCTDDDGVADWLRAGEVLSAMWLRATMEGLSVVPLSQAIEVESTRISLAHDVLGGLATPQILVRIGWQPIGRSQLVQTPRRPVEDVLR